MSNEESLMKTSENILKSLSAIGGLLQQTNSVVEEHSEKISNISDHLALYDQRLNKYENDSEITTEQCKEMKAAVSRRVYKILECHGITDCTEQKKYSHALHSRCWAECRRHSGIASSYPRTKKKDYDQAMEVIEAWVPSEGFSSIKTRCDEVIAAKNRQDIENIAQGLQMFSQKYAKHTIA